MKRLLIFTFLVFVLLLHAENPQEDQLDLGDILIIGETSALSDTASDERDLVQYWHVSEPQQFEFRAFFSTPEIQLPQPFALRDNLAIQIIGGNYYLGNFNGVYSSGDYLRFTFNYYCKKIEEDWKDTKCSFTWQPVFNNHDFNLQLLQDKYESKPGDTKIEGINLKYDNNFISIRNFDSLIFDLSTKLCYNEFSQLDGSAKDIDIVSDMKIEQEKYCGEICLNLLKQTISGKVACQFKDIYFFNKIGIWCAFDEDHIYPAIEFLAKFKILPKLFLKLENKPEISRTSRKDDFVENDFQYLFINNKQTKKQLNGFAIVESDYLFPVSMYYNLSCNDAFHRYVMLDKNYYKQENIDCQVRKIGLKACLKYRCFEFFQDVSYTESDEELYFVPKVINITSLCYEMNLLKFETQFRYLHSRVDDSNEKMNDVFLIDLYGSYKLKENISIITNITNLLNENYKEFSDKPNECIQFDVGLRIMF